MKITKGVTLQRICDGLILGAGVQPMDLIEHNQHLGLYPLLPGCVVLVPSIPRDTNWANPANVTQKSLSIQSVLPKKA
ncbi:hypothetical protein PRUB_b1110 [Pseudoalteromonas rubra]|uniref:LysM domain-containing protein n=1 Tax=Pseudoalteromonas rubra TaxID=43658 RepID=A0A8T0C3K8_9GAMM|nr:hypothetical protein [Pseudoalteromonas rubra]KAF7781781.1 hypothetical protein PRUB_b1110 [Pseudoalteromonas rubra]